PVCGNGYVETGEQCDCGPNATPINCPCCNITSCLFIGNATCSDQNPCCHNCHLRSAADNYVCRTSAGECDIAEVCDGSSELCPSDAGKGSGSSCSTSFGAGYCYSGNCMNYAQQCANLQATFGHGPYYPCKHQADFNQGN